MPKAAPRKRGIAVPFRLVSPNTQGITFGTATSFTIWKKKKLSLAPDEPLVVRRNENVQDLPRDSAHHEAQS